MGSNTGIQRPAAVNTIGQVRQDKVDAMLAHPKLLHVLTEALEPTGLQPSYFLTGVRLAMRDNPALERCDAVSLYKAIALAAYTGSTIGNGMAHLVPYKENCQLIFGYGGLISIAKDEGKILDAQAQPIYEGDEFSWEVGAPTVPRVKINPRVPHPPGYWNNPDTGKAEPPPLLGVVAWARLPNPAAPQHPIDKYIVLTLDDIERAKRSSMGKRDDRPWVTDYVAMAMKTAIKRLMKTIGTGNGVSKFGMAMRAERAYEVGGQVPVAPLGAEFDDLIATTQQQATQQHAPHYEPERAPGRDDAIEATFDDVDQP